ncbi:TRAP transporter small permease [Roseovarius nanhaiticus]|uniref:TRAP transporter small permease n=1 Tax=Roseovarius nanhaiticus TaxID=573024 RepID=UPI0024909062|nr:TRAP transporter small permease subunit [Roseovarius nanhaiticus]
MLHRISHQWARAEMGIAALLAVAITGLVLLNVVTRAMSASIFWVDEAAIYAMTWMTFLAASAAVHFGHSVGVTILTDALPDPAARAAQRAVDVVVLVFAMLMLWLGWRWFLPLDLMRAGFDTMAFQGETFNFIYAEPTLTLGIRKFWLWLIMPIFALGLMLHAVANLLRPLPQGAKA